MVTVLVAALVVVVVLGLTVQVLGWRCWGVESYTISVRDCPNVAAPLGEPHAGDRPGEDEGRLAA